MSEVILKNISGPFGHYPWGSTGALLNSAIAEGIPMTTVENFIINGDRTVSMGGRVVGRYRWFQGIDKPLFQWFVEELAPFNKQLFEVNPDTGEKKPLFKLSLNCHDMPAFEIHGDDAVPELHRFLNGMLTNWMDDPRYKIHQAAGAFFQGGSHDPNGHWFMIEFWKSEGAQAFVDYMNEHYMKALAEYSAEEA